MGNLLETCGGKSAKDKAIEEYSDKELAMFFDSNWSYTHDGNKCDDKDIVLAAVNAHSWAFKGASDRLRGDKEVALAAGKSGKREDDGKWLKFCSKELQADKEIVILAVQWEFHHPVIQFASKELQADPDVLAVEGSWEGRTSGEPRKSPSTWNVKTQSYDE